MSNGDDAGFSIIIPLLRNFWASNAVRRQTNRTSADGIRLAAVMCLQEFRLAMIQFLSRKRKDRAMNNQSVNVDLAVFELMLPTFQDPEFTVDRFEVVNAEEVDPNGKIDPNKDHNWSDRDAAWLMKT